jgi:thiamine-phosphate pyrophosphorylase
MELAAVFRAAPVYAIYDTQVRPEFAAADVIRAWLAAGIRVIQFRHKGPADNASIETCRNLAELVSAQRGIFIVNDRADIALLSNASGVHLGQDDLTPGGARKLLPPPAIIGYSTHSKEQATTALRMPIDYLAVGPVFTTSTKENADPVVGAELVRYARSESSLPLVAIGGINISNLGSVLGAGADAVAMVSDLVKDCKSIDDIQARARAASDQAILARKQAPAAL